EAVTLRTVTLFADEIRVNGGDVKLEREGMRARFALRYGVEQGDDGKAMRHTQVQRAFNSPFWPFVLASTSVGQEGLDFHPYCHAVVHWDLPSNPVDMEQREGRVHRYKGHAIRKNVAGAYAGVGRAGGDPWEAMFGAAAAEGSDLVPYWVYPGPARIERHVPCLPLSRDLERLTALRRSLAVYRMVFGQSRQEDMVAYLLEQVPKETVERVVEVLKVDLGAPGG
ncbi:MAG: helicase-related protein, partial [Bacillota bacterium]